jgi:hypothetical protein
MDFKPFLITRYRWDAGVSRYMVDKLIGDLTEDELNWQPSPGHHSIWHNLWHMYLSNDYYFAAAMDVQPAWEAGDWRNSIDCSAMARAFAQSGTAEDGPAPRFVIADVPDSLVDELKAVPVASYLAYVDELIARTTEILENATEEQLQRRVEWYGRRGPAYARAADFTHVYRHIGMMEDLRGLIRGPGSGTASI